MADPAFRVISSGQTGFFIWRIEKLQVVAVPRESYGKFYDGDAYIIYCATPYGQPGGHTMKSKPVGNDRLEQHIHFWLGLEASHDEATVAAYKTVELDDHLGGSPIQHREIQGHESKRFLSYFKDGLRILHGGISSGLNVVSHEKDPKLFIVKGKRQPVVRQLHSIDWKEFNDGDVFVLDAVQHVFVWTGKQSNRLEKLQGAKLAQKLREEHESASVVFVEDGHEEAVLHGEEKDVFQNFLPLEHKQVRVASAHEEDAKQDIATRNVIKLYQCTDEDGTLRIKEVKGGPLEQSDLLSKDSFIVDNGGFGIWVWVGKRASQTERTEAMRNAQGFIKKKGYDSFTPVTRVIDGGEPMEFRCLFKNWKEKDQTTSFTNKRRISVQTVQTKFDARVLHEQPQLAAESGMVDDGKGAKEIFRVDRFDLLQVLEEDYGKFYSGDCYIILYAYNNGGKDCYLLYYWLGSHSSTDEQGTAALKTIELDNRLGGAAVQVRVVQGKEPTHFLAMFQGQMVVYQGGLASAFDGEKAKDVDVGSTHLLQVHGRTPLSTYATQVTLSAASLNTNDCFVLVSPKETYVWLGKGSTGDEKEMAKRIASYTDKDPTVVYEGQERPDFWSVLGGELPYIKERETKSTGKEDFMPRLFHGSNASGSFKMEEILNFSQVDLVPEDVMLLDVGETLFVWLGGESNQRERSDAMLTARDYLLSDPSGRNPDIPIVVVKQGYEPPNFTGFFGAWDPELLGTTFASAGMNGNSNGIAYLSIKDFNENGLVEQAEFYSYDVLKNTTNLPPNVDPTHKENFLTDEDFAKVFGMDRDAFNAMAGWKKDKLKKSLGLF